MKRKFFILLFSLTAINSFGQVLQCFNNSFSFLTVFNHVIRHDSNYYLDGCYLGQFDQHRMFVKTDVNGNFLKSVSISNDYMNGCGNNHCTSITSSDSGFICAGFIVDSAYRYHSALISINENLDTIWTKKYSYQIFSTIKVDHEFTDIKRTFEGGYLISGFYSDTTPYSPRNPFLMKTDENGNIQWLKKYNFSNTYFSHIEVCQDHSILLFSVKSPSTLYKTDALGNIIWERQFTGNYIYFSEGDITKYSPYEYIIASPYRYKYDAYEIWTGLYLCKINVATNTILWDTMYIPFETFDTYPGMKVRIDQTGKILVGATAYVPLDTESYTEKRGLFLYFNQNGDSIGYKSYKYSNWTFSDFLLNDILIENSGEVGVVGQIRSGGWISGWFFRTSANGYLNTFESIDEVNNLKIFPNPASDYCYLKMPIDNPEEICLIDVNGKKIFQPYTKSSKGLIQINIEKLKSGLYIVKVRTNSNNYYSKILIQH